MRRILVFTVALFLVLTLALVVLAQASSKSGSPTLYTVEQGTVSGGSYCLTGLTWQVSGAASGGSYRLLGPAAPRLRGSGCCCTYLPLGLRDVP
jgi:hypothetical protein